MKNHLLLLFTYLFFAFVLITGCSKEKPFDNPTTATTDSTEIKKAQIDTCTNPVSKGRIIGFSPFMSFDNFDTSRFIKYDPTLGPGYLIEIDNGLTKDTTVTYRITYNKFQFTPSLGRIASFCLFKNEYQDSLKIKFNYKVINNKTEIRAFATSYGWSMYDWNNFIQNKKEIIVSCVASQ